MGNKPNADNILHYSFCGDILIHMTAYVMNKIRVLIADDHPIVRMALRTIIGKETDIEVVGEAENGKQAIDLVEQLVPNAVIMDISMPCLNGLEATRQIREKYPEIRVIVLTVHDDNEHIFGMLEAGASSYITKTTFGESLPSVIRAVAAGETVLSPDVSRRLLQHALRYPVKPASTGGYSRLSTRELEIITLLTEGISNKDIASRLFISIPSVKNRLAEIFSKLGVSSRTEAVITAIRTNLVTLNDQSGK